jgi:hypothetical protein
MGIRTVMGKYVISIFWDGQLGLEWVATASMEQIARHEMDSGNWWSVHWEWRNKKAWRRPLPYGSARTCREHRDSELILSGPESLKSK